MSSLIGKLLARSSGAGKPMSPIPYSGTGHLSISSMQNGSDPEAYMRAYQSSGTVFSIVSMLARQTAKTHWHLYRKAPVDGRRRYTTADKGSDQRTEVINHLAIDLWNRPNPFMSGFQLRELCQTYLDLTGEAYIVVQRDGRATFPMGLWPARPDRMQPIPSKDKFLAGYVYQGPSGELVPLQPDEVIQLKYPNPFDPYKGMGPIQSILVDIDAAKYSATWNRNFFLNSATPGGVIQIDKRLSDDEWNEFTNRWRETHRGVGASHRVAVLESGAVWVPNAHTIRDMDFANLRGVSRDVIREAFAMHKSILGTSDDVNRANAQTAKELFESFQITDRLDRWSDALDCSYLPLFGSTGEGVEFDYENPVSSNREADALELKEKSEAALGLVTAGFDPHDVLEAVGLPDMSVVEQATQMPAVPPKWVPAPPAAPAAPGEPAAPSARISNLGGDAAAEVYEQAAADYPPEATAWMHHAQWKGPLLVPLDHIDPTPDWIDETVPDRVKRAVKKLKKGKTLKPAILVKTPTGDKLQLVDGHHRYIASFEAGVPLNAYVGTVSEDHGPWETMHGQQREGSNAAKNRAKAAATLSKAQVHYRDTSSQTRNCGTCSMFRAPHGCTLVKGIINADDVCDRWDPKRTDARLEAMMAQQLSWNKAGT